MVICGGIGVILALLFWFTQPWLLRRQVELKTSSTAGNMKDIGLVLREYADDHSGKFPIELSVLVEEHYMTSGSIWICPGMGRRAPASIKEIRLGQHDYIYLAAGANLNSLAHPQDIVVVMHSRAGALPGHWVVVLFADAHVECIISENPREYFRNHTWLVANEAHALP